jgi:hypothetical protein
LNSAEGINQPKVEKLRATSELTMWLSEMNRKCTQLRSQLKNHRESLFSVLEFLAHPNSEIEMINYKDLCLLIDSSPDAILEFINTVTD